MLAIYTRVSTQEQASKGVSLENQLDRGIRKAQSLGLEYIHFEDAGLSGNLNMDKRPGFKKLLDAIAADTITHLYVYDIERLSRGNVLDFESVKSILLEKNVKLFEDNTDYDLTDDGSNFMISIKQMFGHYERSKRKRSIITNLEDNARKGKWGGGNRLPYGYMREEKMLVINPIEAEIIKEAFTMSLDNKGMRVICNIFNEKEYPTRIGGKWREGTMHHILTNPIYYGHRRYKEIEGGIKAPAIISKELFDMVQKNLTNNIRFKPDKKHFYLLKGLIKCGQCGKSFYGKKRSDLKDKAYVCLSQRYTKEFCGCRGIDIDYLDSVVVNSINALPTHINKFYKWFEKNDMIKMVQMELSTNRKKEVELEKKKQKFIDLAFDSEMDKSDFNKKIKNINEDIEECKKKKLDLIPQLGVLDNKEDVIKMVNDFIYHMEEDSQKQNVVRALVEKVSVMWVPDKKYHIIVINYKIDSLSEYKLSENLQVEYQQKGFRLDRKVSMTNLSIFQMGSEVHVSIVK